MNKIRHIFNNRINALEIVYAVAFGLMTVLSRHTVYSDEVGSSIMTVYISPFKAVDIVIFPVVAVIIYLCIQLIRYLLGKMNPFVFGSRKQLTVRKKAILWIVIFAVIMICYIPYMMSCWPGGIYNDTCDSIDIALGRSAMSNQNTVLYALFWRIVFTVGSIFNQGDYGGLKLMTVLQPAAIAAVAASFITWLRGRGAGKWLVVMLTAITALFPVFPYYGISLWKETWFGLEFFLYTWIWFVLYDEFAKDTADDDGTDEQDDKKEAPGKTPGIKMTVLYVMSTMLVIFGRNNGLYVVLFTMVIAQIILYNVATKGTWRRLLLVNIIIVIFALLLQGPVYRAAGVKSSSPAESLGIPLQQTAYMISKSAVTGLTDIIGDEIETDDPAGDIDMDAVVREGLGMSDQSYEVIDSVMPIDAWVNLYNPVVVDSIKFGEFFDKDYFASHTGDFLRAYAELVFKNPKLAFQGYLLSTMGFWDAYKSSSSAYICTAHTAQAEYFMSDYFNVITDRNLSDIVGPRWYISGGGLVWIMLALFVLCSGRSGREHTDKPEGGRAGGKECRARIMSTITFLPGIALWLTYMLATPLSFSFRYVFGLLLCIPIYIMAAIKNAQA